VALVACSAPFVTLPHDSRDPTRFVAVQYDYNRTEVASGDSLVVVARLRNISSRPIRLLPKFQFGHVRYSVTPATRDSVERLRQVTTGYHRGPCRSGEVSMQIELDRAGPHWKCLKPGETLSDTLVFSHEVLMQGGIPGIAVRAPEVWFETPLEEVDLPASVKYHRYLEDSVAIAIR